MVDSKSPFKWHHFQSDLILLTMRWYCRYTLSYRDLEEMMAERDIEVDHRMIYRWVQEYAPDFDKCIRPHLNLTNDSWRVDETYIKIKGTWKYLYHAVDSEGNTLDFMLSAKRDGKAAERFLRQVLRARHTRTPRVINVDKDAACPVTAESLDADEAVETKIELRQVKYLNNMIEQDHRNIKRIIKPMMGFKSFNTARRTLRGIESMNMIRKGQVTEIDQGNSVTQAKFVAEIFGVAA